MQIYWTKRELQRIIDALEKQSLETGRTDLTREDILQKCLLGISALEAYEKGDEVSKQLLEVCQKQNESEALV
jgi:hypothetical protein